MDLVKKLPVIQETQVRFLSQEDPLEEETATHSSTLAWRILWTEEPGGLQSMGSHGVRHDLRLNYHHRHSSPYPLAAADFLKQICLFQNITQLELYSVVASLVA